LHASDLYFLLVPVVSLAGVGLAEAGVGLAGVGCGGRTRRRESLRLAAAAQCNGEPMRGAAQPALIPSRCVSGAVRGVVALA